MRIVLLTTDLSGRSGWSRYALDLGKALKAEGYDVHCIVAEKSDVDWCSEYAILRPATTYLNAAFLRKYDAWRLGRLLKKIQPDIVHVIVEPYALMLPLIKNHPWNICMTIHGTYSVLPLSHGHGSRPLFEQAYHLCDAVISVSEFTKKYVQTRASELYQNANLANKITVISNAIDLTRFPFVSKQPSTKKHIMSVGGVKPKKGYSQAIEAVAAFLKEHPMELTYDIFGSTTMDSAFFAVMTQRVEELGLSQVILFHGSVDDATVDAAYANADVFLMPSLHEGDHFEGFGLVFLEANARGVPVIGGNTGGSPEAIQEGLSGYTCDPDDQTMLVQRLEDILIKNTIKPIACRMWAEAHDITKTAKTIGLLYHNLPKKG